MSYPPTPTTRTPPEGLVRSAGDELPPAAGYESDRGRWRALAVRGRKSTPSSHRTQPRRALCRCVGARHV